MEQKVTEKIAAFLALGKPSDEQIIEGATLLLQLNPNRERGIYNSTLIRPKAMLAWIRADLKKYLGIRQRGLEGAQIEKYNRETLKRVEQTLSLVPSGAAQEGGDAPVVPVLGTRGMREDHDRLPPEVQAIWERNADRWKKMSRLHFQLAQMIAKPGYAPCDGNELCYQLRQVDDELRNDYEIYDTYVVGSPADMAADAPDSVEVFTDNVKTIQNARTAISRGLVRKPPHTEESLRKLQDAVNTLFALKQAIRTETIERLKDLGIAVPIGNYAEG